MAQGGIVDAIKMSNLQTMFDEKLILVVSADQYVSSVLNSNLTKSGLKPIFVSSAAKAQSILRHARECESPIPLVLYDHQCKYCSEFLSRNPYPKKSFHITAIDVSIKHGMSFFKNSSRVFGKS